MTQTQKISPAMRKVLDALDASPTRQTQLRVVYGHRTTQNVYLYSGLKQTLAALQARGLVGGWITSGGWCVVTKPGVTATEFPGEHVTKANAELVRDALFLGQTLPFWDLFFASLKGKMDYHAAREAVAYGQKQGTLSGDEHNVRRPGAVQKI